ncbi:MAG: 50S ribosomal protein L17 [Bacteroidetes bacterium]|jgi:large subunit ribosomal protein L17|nr:50S ribosomal protein L17 [Bacteroidota bacterium]MCL5034008.1 50S ribosomal protein L17 [Bacteroidota bacterium]
MRHLNSGRKLKRTASHRKALMESLATSLILYKQVRTTLAKAKETRVFIEPLITKAKKDSVPARRHVSRFIKDREAVKILFGEIAPRVQDRPGGYTRVVKLGQRHGDGGEVAIIELVDFNAADEAEKRRKAPKEKEAGTPQEQAKEEKKEAASAE